MMVWAMFVPYCAVHGVQSEMPLLKRGEAEIAVQIHMHNEPRCRDCCYISMVEHTVHNETQVGYRDMRFTSEG